VNTAKPIKSQGKETEIKPWAEVLADGTQVVVRKIAPMDAKLERAFTDSLSPELRSFDFLGQLRPSSSTLPTQFDIDHANVMSLGAFTTVDGKETLLGIGRYSPARDGSSCECQLTLSEAWHHKGLGTVLIKHLIEVARKRDIFYMFAVGGMENTEMAELAQRLGFTRQVDPQDPAQAIYSIWI